MKVDANSWLGRLAFGVNPYIQDECSLYRALVWGLIKRGFFGVFIPTVVAVGIFGTTMVGIELERYPWLVAMDGVDIVLIDFIAEVYWAPISILIVLSICFGMFALTVLPVVLALGLFCLLVIMIWQHIVVRITKRVGQVTVAKVIATGISNQVHRLCRPIEVVNSRIPAGFVNGAHVVVRGREGIVQDLSVRHGDNRVAFDLVSPTIEDVSGDWSYTWNYIAFHPAEGDIIVLDSEK